MTGRLAILLSCLVLTGCAESFTVFDTQTGEPILLGRRSHSYEDCISAIREEASQLGMTLRYVHVRGSTIGRSLLWPFEAGYACEAAAGRPIHPNGIYLNVPPRVPQG